MKSWSRSGWAIPDSCWRYGAFFSQGFLELTTFWGTEPWCTEGKPMETWLLYFGAVRFSSLSNALQLYCFERVAQLDSSLFWAACLYLTGGPGHFESGNHQRDNVGSAWNLHQLGQNLPEHQVTGVESNWRFDMSTLGAKVPFYHLLPKKLENTLEVPNFKICLAPGFLSLGTAYSLLFINQFWNLMEHMWLHVGMESYGFKIAFVYYKCHLRCVSLAAFRRTWFLAQTATISLVCWCSSFDMFWKFWQI